ncbi:MULTISPECIES: chaperonin GroEL [Bacteria]|uniref:chaperonin GroEL n=1 Tax=Bacteria TaxID=2 RepID=UPI003F30FFAB
MKKIFYNKDAKDKIEEAVNIIYEAVAHTLGPKGGNTAFSISNSTPIVTNDGVSIAKEISVKDPAINIGIELIKQAAIKANEEAGDGTTTSIVLTKFIFEEGMKLIELGANPISLRDGMYKALNEILELISKSAKAVSTNNDILNIATISSGSKELGEVILKAFSEIGEDGILQVEKGNNEKTFINTINGFHICTGPVDEHFLKEKELKLENCYILNTNIDFDKPKAIRSLLNMLNNQEKPCILIGNSFSQEVISNLLINFQRDIVCIPIEAPSFGPKRTEVLEDLAFITKSELIDKNDNIHLEVLTEKELINKLGVVKELKIKKDLIIFTELLDEKLLKKRVEELKEKNVDKERISKLVGGISTIYVGGLSRLEVDERYYRVEDAINATNSAIKEGIVPGAGSVFYNISTTKISLKEETDFDKGYNMLYKVLINPFEVICKNSGLQVKELSFVNKENSGIDASTGEICNLIERGIIDPAKTLKSSLKAAVSVASTILTTNCIVVDEEEKKGYKSFL